MILYVIRHGETAWNKVRRLQGQTDIPLAEEGIRLAKETGIGMKDIPIDLVISSPLQRALQTADCITEGRNIPILTDPGDLIWRLGRRVADRQYHSAGGL